MKSGRFDVLPPPFALLPWLAAGKPMKTNQEGRAAMKLAKILLGGTLAVMGLSAIPVRDTWSRPPIEVCQSRHDRYQYCPADTRGGVRLYRQLSNSACIPNQTWGYDRGGIWVDKGCRAEFAIGGYNRDDDGDYRGGYDGGYRGGYDGEDRYYRRGGRSFVCDAQGPGYRYCRADVRGEVRLIRQLSKNPCRLNDSWGYDRGGVWVDKGCRAEFEVR